MVVFGFLYKKNKKCGAKLKKAIPKYITSFPVKKIEIIRGTSSFHASNAALIVVDGVISDNDVLRTLSPIEVKSVDVIKDGSSAVYGSRGANGVVIIETRKGGDEIK